jgi:hypothetical protein
MELILPEGFGLHPDAVLGDPGCHVTAMADHGQVQEVLVKVFHVLHDAVLQ